MEDLPDNKDVTEEIMKVEESWLLPLPLFSGRLGLVGWQTNPILL